MILARHRNQDVIELVGDTQLVTDRLGCPNDLRVTSGGELQIEGWISSASQAQAGFEIDERRPQASVDLQSSFHGRFDIGHVPSPHLTKRVRAWESRERATGPVVN